MKPILDILNEIDCCGCGSCAQCCPKQCIRMVPNQEGFLYPQINRDTCIECGLCQKHCPQMQEPVHRPMQKAYVVQCCDVDRLSRSASGGAFAALATRFLDNKGAVVGAAFSNTLVATHVVVERMEDLHKLQGSKYVASDLGDVYSRVKSILADGREVLFSGTPCQIAGLNAFLSKKYDNLTTVDLACHGTPSAQLFDAYLKWLGKKHGGVIEKYRFRDKGPSGWGLVGSFACNGATTTLNPYCDPYYATFLRGETYRKSCYRCKYANLDRPADLTIGDFWGISQYSGKHDFTEKLGLSLLLVNSEKGRVVFESILDKVKVMDLSVDEACAGNGNLYRPTAEPAIRDVVYKQMETMSFDELQRHYLAHESPFMWRVRRIRRKLLPRKLRDFLKGILRF